MARTQKSQTEFVLCINNSEDDLQKGKMYKVVSDESAAKSKYISVVDDSGEDYLYPSAYFIKIELPQEAKRALSRAS